MRVPLLLHVFPTFAAAGSQVRTVRLISALGDRYTHLVVSNDGRRGAERLLPEGARVEIVAPPATGTLRRVAWFRRVFERRRPDLLLTYNWGSFDAVIARASFPSVPHIHHEDGFNADEARRFKRRRVLARRFLLRRADRVVVCSKTLERVALEVWRLPPDHVVTLRNGLDVARFGGGDRAAARRDLRLPERATVVGSVGHLRPVKNHVRLLRAVALALPHAHVLLVGDGPLRPALIAEARTLNLGDRLVLPGHIDDPRDAYAAMDLFCLSSDSEQHPVSLLEAMASALPVAATDVGDVRDVLPEPQHPFVVPSEGHEPLAGALGRLAGLPADERGALGRANRRRVERDFSLEEMVRAYDELYASCL